MLRIDKVYQIWSNTTNATDYSVSENVIACDAKTLAISGDRFDLGGDSSSECDS